MTFTRRPALSVIHVDTERSWRGGEQQVLWLAEALAAIGIRSLIAARQGSALAQRATAAGIQVVACDPAGELAPLSALRLRGVVKRERIDIVHAHTAHAVALAAMATLNGGHARAGAAKMVVTRHVEFPPRGNFATMWKYGRAHAVIAVSAAVRESLLASRVVRVPVDIIPAGIDLSRDVRPASAASLASLGVPLGAPVVVMAAALTAEKDPVTFVRAAYLARRRVPALHAILLGEGSERAAVEQALREQRTRDSDDGADWFHLAGFREDAVEIMAAANVVASSSVKEGFGLSLLEAMASGKPVVATATGGVVDLVENGRSGLLVAPADAERLGDAIAAILTDNGLGARLRDGATRRATEFSMERVAERTARVYDRVMAVSR
ncbi:MAG: glycosyltransferase family 4 protein [Gemmatimonadaceae bacterium]